MKLLEVVKQLLLIFACVCAIIYVTGSSNLDGVLYVCQVPGLFEGDEYTTLMTQCKEGSQREGLMLDSSEELYKWFTQQVGVAVSFLSSFR